MIDILGQLKRTSTDIEKISHRMRQACLMRKPCNIVQMRVIDPLLGMFALYEDRSNGSVTPFFLSNCQSEICLNVHI